MASALKKSIKAVLPNSFISWGIEQRDKMEFLSCNQLAFDESPLREQSELDLDAIFADPEINKSWEADHQNIASIYGNDDQFGGVNPGDRRAIYYLVKANKPKTILEVGTHIGASTIHIARALSGIDAEFSTVDILDVNDPETGSWKKVGLEKSPKEYAEELSCADVIDFQVSPCLDFMENSKKKFDFIFLDGDHSAKAVYQEVSAALKVLNDSGVILLHDFYPEAKPLYPDNNTISGPYLAMERVKKENPKITVTPLGDLPWPTKQGVNMTSLAIVSKL